MGAKPALVRSSVLSGTILDSVGAWTASGSMLVVDFLALSAIYWIVVIGRHLVSPGYTLTYYLALFPAIGLFLAAFLIQGLYPGLLLHPAEEMRRVFYCVSSVFLLICSMTFWWRNGESYSRSVFLLTWACGAPVVLLARWLARSVLARRSRWGISAVIVGSGPAAQRVARSLKRCWSGIRVKGVLTEEHHFSWSADLPPILGDLTIGPYIAATSSVQYAIVAMPHKSSSELREIIQNHCAGFRHILLMPDLPGLCSLGMTAREIGGEVGFEVPQRLFHRSSGALKRALDFSLSVAVVMLLLPLFLLVLIAVKVTSRGPAFYGHARYGRNGQVFKALKFRTMVENSDEVLAEHLRAHPEQLRAWQEDHKLKADPRVTSIGTWLRRYSLDELPQLLNVITGHMSLVGPRPIVKAEIPKYGTGYELYTRVRPGITGLWQISGRNNTTYEERVAFDEYYVRNWSVWLDVYILSCTFKAVLAADGAY